MELEFLEFFKIGYGLDWFKLTTNMYLECTLIDKIIYRIVNGLLIFILKYLIYV